MDFSLCSNLQYVHSTRVLYLTSLRDANLSSAGKNEIRTSTATKELSEASHDHLYQARVSSYSQRQRPGSQAPPR